MSDVVAHMSPPTRADTEVADSLLFRRASLMRKKLF